MLFKQFKDSIEAHKRIFINDKFIYPIVIKVNTHKTMYTLLPEGYMVPEYKCINVEEALAKFGNRAVDYVHAEMIGVDECAMVFYLNKDKTESWLDFEPMVSAGLTERFKVVSKSDGSILGVIKWHTGYRKYAFFVTSRLYRERDYNSGLDNYKVDSKVFDNDCMREITLFVEQLMIDYKLEKENK